MSKRRTTSQGSVAGAVLGVVLAPRFGEPRRVALERLRLAVRPGRGSLGAFAGTPCASADPADPDNERPAAPDRPTGTGGATHG